MNPARLWVTPLPEGATAIWEPLTHRLTVWNTEENLEKVDQLLAIPAAKGGQKRRLKAC